MKSKSLTQLCLIIISIVGTSLFTPYVASESEPNTQSETTTKSDQYRLGAGDEVRVTVFGHPDLSGQFQLDGNGRISLPLIKEVQATGKTAAELEASISEKLSPDYLKNPKVSVEVLNYRPFYIIGEVKNPGQYAYVNDMTILTAVALAGGYTYRAKTTKAFITHAQGKKGVKVQKKEVPQNTQILPGDIIEIPEKYWLF